MEPLPKLPEGAKLITEIQGFEQCHGYAITKSGKVLSCRRNGVFMGTFSDEWKEHKIRLDSKKYVRLALTIKYKRKDYRVHILAASLHVPNPHGYKEVNHLDGNRQNNNDWNLQWCTHKMNIQHSYDHLNRQRLHGTKSPAAKLDDVKVVEIKSKLLSGETIRGIANQFGVHHSIISGIKRGSRWAHVV